MSQLLPSSELSMQNINKLSRRGLVFQLLWKRGEFLSSIFLLSIPQFLNVVFVSDLYPGG